MPAFVVKDGKGYRGIVEKPLIVSCDEDIPVAAKKVIDIFERYIKKYPDQWYNFTPFRK